MIEKMTIGDKEMEFKASAATPILYKKIFSTDLLVELSGLTKLDDQTTQGAKMNDIISGLAYVMYCEANMKSTELFTRLNQQSYIEWLMTIENIELTKNSANFIRLYQGNQKSDNKSKNA